MTTSSRRRRPRRAQGRSLRIATCAAVVCASLAAAPALASATPSSSAGEPNAQSSSDSARSSDSATSSDAATTVDAVTSGGGSAGAVYSRRPITRSNLVPGAASGTVFTYATTGADHKPQRSSGMLLTPFGSVPAGGFPVIAWAHGSRGLADGCAPSVRPAVADLDQARAWLSRGYAVVSTDYAGLGTAGTPQYFDTDATARNIVDAVRATQSLRSDVSRRWAVVGQGQGAAAAVTLARIGPTLGGPSLDFRGAAASSIPAQFSSLLTKLGPGTVNMPAGLTADALYTLSAISSARPSVDVVNYLTESGRSWLNRAAQLCVADLTREVDGVSLGSLFSKPLSNNRELAGVLEAASVLPVRGFTRPVMMTQGLVDPSVIVPLTLNYINDARMADRQVSPRPYLTLSADGANRMADNDIRSFIATVMR
ncbi:lipase family protein [Gordonia sputi]|uniref:lipase family protein n=1 Tax=Gordonia sputi TaxID=36823 RepID=UPI003983F940